MVTKDIIRRLNELNKGIDDLIHDLEQIPGEVEEELSDDSPWPDSDFYGDEGIK